MIQAILRPTLIIFICPLQSPSHLSLHLKGTISYRNDRHVIVYSDRYGSALNSKTYRVTGQALKGKIVYDNTRKRAINIYYGTRFKIFGEYYKELNYGKSDMIVVGLDFRNYIRIHRELIWANSFAASTSYGPTKLVYYLGGVDNWMGISFQQVRACSTSQYL